MLRIYLHTFDGKDCLALEGDLTAEGAKDLASCCRTLLGTSRGRSIWLDISRVSRTDEQARQVLHHLAGRGISLIQSHQERPSERSCRNPRSAEQSHLFSRFWSYILRMERISARNRYRHPSHLPTSVLSGRTAL